MARGAINLIGVLLLIGGTVDGQRHSGPATQPAPQAASVPKGNVDHGRYLVEEVVMCFQCHSSRDESGNIIPTTRFYGGPVPMQPPWPSDWALAAPRIAGLVGYTDEQAIRLLTQGAIKRDGTPLRRPMPPFRMTPQDAADVIAYIRTR
jgi:mono/diheme cytochrome c family protein